MIFFLKIEKEDEYYYIGEVRLKLGSGCSNISPNPTQIEPGLKKSNPIQPEYWRWLPKPARTSGWVWVGWSQPTQLAFPTIVRNGPVQAQAIISWTDCKPTLQRQIQGLQFGSRTRSPISIYAKSFKRFFSKRSTSIDSEIKVLLQSLLPIQWIDL